jgi:protease I
MLLEGTRIAFFVDEGFEDLEFWVPYMRLLEEGASITVVGTKAGKVVQSKSGGLTATVEKAAGEVDSSGFDAAVIPGGWAPDKLRRDQNVIDLVRALYEESKIVAMICHGGSVGLSAGILEGHRATGSNGIKDDLLLAGVTWVDEPAFQDENLVWGRVDKDVPDFCRVLVRALAEG